MPDLRIHRDHSLGLERAREVARQWADDAESRFQMECTLVEGEYSDTVQFKRSGVSGRLIVAADHFDLDAKLGFLLGAFSKTIESEIEKNLDALLASSAAAQKPAAKGGAKPAAKAPAKAPANAGGGATKARK